MINQVSIATVMMKKILLSLLLCLPLIATAQVKSGIPISEVVRQAQAEVAQRKKNRVQQSEKIIIRTIPQEPSTDNSRYNPYDAVAIKPTATPNFTHQEQAIIRTPRPPRTPYINPMPKLPRTQKAPALRNTEFDEQLDFTNQFGLSLSTNALMWVTAIPNIDVRFQYDKFSAVGSFGFASWNMPNQKFWWITSLGGELHYDIIPNLYVGAMYNWFNYNIKFGVTGNQGITQSVGAVVGYKLPIGRKLALDFGLGLGYALVDNERYHEEGTTFVRDKNRKFGYWGPIKAQVSLVWRIL